MRWRIFLLVSGGITLCRESEKTDEDYAQVWFFDTNDPCEASIKFARFTWVYYERKDIKLAETILHSVNPDLLPDITIVESAIKNDDWIRAIRALMTIHCFSIPEVQDEIFIIRQRLEGSQ